MLQLPLRLPTSSPPPVACLWRRHPRGAAAVAVLTAAALWGWGRASGPAAVEPAAPAEPAGAVVLAAERHDVYLGFPRLPEVQPFRRVPKPPLRRPRRALRPVRVPGTQAVRPEVRAKPVTPFAVPPESEPGTPPREPATALLRELPGALVGWAFVGPAAQAAPATLGSRPEAAVRSEPSPEELAGEAGDAATPAAVPLPSDTFVEAPAGKERPRAERAIHAWASKPHPQPSKSPSTGATFPRGISQRHAPAAISTGKIDGSRIAGKAGVAPVAASPPVESLPESDDAGRGLLGIDGKDIMLGDAARDDLLLHVLASRFDDPAPAGVPPGLEGEPFGSPLPAAGGFLPPGFVAGNGPHPVTIADAYVPASVSRSPAGRILLAPEPGTATLFGIGLAGLSALHRRRRGR
jgi:hypothetical protein